jgi:hypothetical protein
MKRSVGVTVLVVGTLASCREYDYRSRLSDEPGLVPAEQFARYGREQAQLVAAGRELAHAGDSTGAAVEYARALPDIVDVVGDAQGHWLTLTFKSGWRAAVPPIADGKRGAETPGLPAQP